MADAYKGTEITKLLVFGTKFPDPNDYNLHIRPTDAPNPSITYDASWYMNNSGGRFALPALFPAVRKFFDTPLPDGT
jgi:hypothetical protein